METKGSSYDAVFHFRDQSLFETFMTGISATDPRDYLRKDEGLRNRCFPGFRITRNLPTNTQINNAFKREIVERNNGTLASKLCSAWIRERRQLSKDALACFGICSDMPENPSAWITQIQTALDESPFQEQFEAYARTMAPKYGSDEILIFASIVSYGCEQPAVRKSVESQLVELNSDPTQRKQLLEQERASAAARVQESTHKKQSLQNDLEELRKQSDAQVSELLASQSDLERRIANIDTTIGDLSRELERLRIERQNHEQSREAAQKELQGVSKSIKQGRIELSKRAAEAISQIQDADRDLKLESERIASIESDLEELDRAIQANLVAETSVETKAIAAGSVEELIQLQAVADGAESTLGLVEESPLPGSSIEGTSFVGNNAICYQAVQRTFRNAMVAFVRERFSHLFPHDHTSRLTNMFGDEWVKAADNAARSRENLGTTTQIRDEYDLLGTNHFFNVFDKHYDKLFTPEAGQSPSLPKPVKARFLGNLKAIKDCRDPLSHPVEAEVSSQEANHLLYCAQEILRWIGCTEESQIVADLASRIGNSDKDAQSQVRRLPSEDSIYLEFVGRNTLLNDLTVCFNNPDNKRCLLAGDGGKGKSAAAFRFVQSRPKCLERYQLVLWLSAKKRRFREGVSAIIEAPDFTSLEEAIDRLLREFGATDEEMTQSSSAKKKLVLEYLNEFPAFIIADDIDTVLEDDEIVGLFTHDIPHTASAVLLTSRRAIPGIRSFTVRGFEMEEAEEFIKSRIRLYGLDPSNFTSAVVKKITKATDGSPLYMDDLLRLASIVDIKMALKTWEEKAGDEARKYALQREIEKLSVDARKILVAAAVQDDPVSFDELKHVVEFSDDRLISSLSELQTLFLFPKAPAVEGEQRFQINLNTKKLVRMVEGASDFYNRIDNRSKALAGKLPTVEHGTISSLIRQAFLRLNSGQEADAEAILVRAIERYPNAADLHGFLGYAYKRTGRVVDARNHFESAYKLHCAKQDTYVQWVRMEAGAREWLKVIDVTDRALKILPETYELVERKANALRQAGHDLHRGLHYDKAARMWMEAVDLVTKHIKPPESLPAGERTLNSSMYNTIVICLNMLKRHRDRDHWLERWEREHPDDPQVATQREYANRGRAVALAGIR